MGRPQRAALGGYVYHMLNRRNGRLPMFRKDADYAAFEGILAEALEHVPGMRLLAYCLMPNHWHLVVWPRKDGELSDFGHWLTLTHTQRWHAHHRDVGTGHLYQGRFKSFPVSQDEYFLQLCRYVERNPLRAGLVEQAEAWRWGSLWQRQQEPRPDKWILSDWPIAIPGNWIDPVNQPQTEADLEALRRSVQRGQPYGAETWIKRVAGRLGLESTLRARGRPRRLPEAGESENKGS
jgi:putative transposase